VVQADSYENENPNPKIHFVPLKIWSIVLTVRRSQLVTLGQLLAQLSRRLVHQLGKNLEMQMLWRCCAIKKPVHQQTTFLLKIGSFGNSHPFGRSLTFKDSTEQVVLLLSCFQT